MIIRQIIFIPIVGILFITAGCMSNIVTQTSSSIPTETVISQPGIPIEGSNSHSSRKPLTDEQVEQVLAQLSTGSSNETQEAIDLILNAGDTRFIAVFIELIRAFQIGIVNPTSNHLYINALETLSRQDFGNDWFTWVEWYGGTELEPPPGFTGWKGEILGRIDSEFAEFLQDEHPSRIRVEEIQWGGVAVDGIPALDNPAMITAQEATYLLPDEPVFGVSINSDHRAYPLRIMDWHEMANDVVGNTPISLAYCTLCGAAIAYDGRASDGTTYTFGSSGFLFRSNKLMYDRQTRTLWNQLTGEPVLGRLVDKEVRLDLLPVVVTTWEDWQIQHPDTVVLDPETGYRRPYNLGAAYGEYFASADTMFPVWQRSDQLNTKDRIYALQIDGIPKAYPVEILTEELVINDTIGETSVVLVATRGSIEVEGIDLSNRPAGAVSYDSGGEVRAFNRGEESFKTGPTPDTVLDSNGREWQVTEEGLIGPQREIAPRINGHLAYWFGWFSFFPNTLLYGGQTE